MTPFRWLLPHYNLKALHVFEIPEGDHRDDRACPRSYPDAREPCPHTSSACSPHGGRAVPFLKFGFQTRLSGIEPTLVLTGTVSTPFCGLR